MLRLQGCICEREMLKPTFAIAIAENLDIADGKLPQLGSLNRVGPRSNIGSGGIFAFN
jgi:hypothetical protein